MVSQGRELRDFWRLPFSALKYILFYQIVEP